MHDLGRYVPVDSPVHRIDPRVKVLAVLALSITMLHLSAAGLIALTFILMGFSAIGKISWRMLLKTTRPLWIFFSILFCIYILFTPGKPILPFSTGPFTISYNGLHGGAAQVGRFILLILVASLLTMTTSLSELTLSLEWLLRPLSIVGISSHNLAMMVSMALRFFPTLQEEIISIKEAQLARGANFIPESLSGKIRAMVFVATPLTLNILRRSDQLVEAMESRGFQPGPRTYLYELAFTKTDWVALGLIALTIVLIWFLF